MSVQRYWHERLYERRPIRDDAWWSHMVTYRDEDPVVSWPEAISRLALYKDYLTWHEERVVDNYQFLEYFEKNPQYIPKPATELEFYATMAPWIYIFDKDRQVRSYWVQLKEYAPTHQRWVTIKKRRNFIRLGTWEEHIAAFEFHTGIYLSFGEDWHLKSPAYIARAERLAEARQAFNERVERNKEALPEGMQSPLTPLTRRDSFGNRS